MPLASCVESISYFLFLLSYVAIYFNPVPISGSFYYAGLFNLFNFVLVRKTELEKTMRYYPDSKVEVQGFEAKYYDKLLNYLTFGSYAVFIKKAIASMEIKPEDKILDFGAGTGRNALLMHRYLNENGKILGLEISEEMLKQFRERTKDIPNIDVLEQRIDIPFELDEKYDKALISFVIHGFPHEVRKQIIRNVFNNLKPGGYFNILDFNEFKLNEIPFYARFVFTKVECKYAFDFVERDWKKILTEFGFGNFEEKRFFGRYVRLLKAQKIKE